MSTLIIVIFVILLLAAIPSWRYRNNWGYAPGGGLVGILLILLILYLLGVLK